MWNKIVSKSTKYFVRNLFAYSQQKPNRDLYGN